MRCRLAVTVHVSVEIPTQGIGVGSPEKLAAVPWNDHRTPVTLNKAEFMGIADDAPSGDPLRKIPEGSLPRSNSPM